MTSMQDSDWKETVDRVVDAGGFVGEEEDEDFGYSGPNLVVFALDPGATSGWSLLKVPVGRLLGTGTARTLPWCRWRHGQIQRSGVPGTGPVAQAVSDSRHVSVILDLARNLHEEFVYEGDEEEGWPADVFVFVFESFSLRMMSQDTNLLAPVRVLDRVLDRLWMSESTLPIFHQQPSEAKASVSNTRLKSWGMYDSSSGEHARDADRHAIYFLRRLSDSRELQSRLGLVD